MSKLEKHLLNYFQGKGIDTSREPLLREYPEANVTCLFKEPNNLYHFYEDEGVNYESFDFVFNQDLLSETKFSKILFKEWFYLLRVGGNLVMIFEENEIFDGASAPEVFSNLMGDCGAVLYVKKNGSEGFTVIVQKLKSVLSDFDGIDKWSFCIVNQSYQSLEKLVNSIEAQNIPFFEIIVESPVDFLKDNECVRVVHLYEDESKPSTSMKKNQMLLSAKYENVVIIDNKKCGSILDQNWYKETKRYGNYFECLSSTLVTPEGQRYSDWWTLGRAKTSVSEKLFQTSRLGLLEGSDWDEWAYFPDPICILKKDLYQKTMWDDYSVEGEENIQFCHELQTKGAILRFNPALICKVENEEFELLAKNFPHFIFDKEKLGKRKGKRFRRAVWMVAEMFTKNGKTRTLRERVIKFLKSVRLYNLLARK